MVPLTSLWLAIVLSGVIVFVASSIIHMLLGYHKNDFRQLPREDEVLEALRKFELAPGDYMLPRPKDRKDMNTPAFLDKLSKGPVALITVIPNGPPTMGKHLTNWFLYCLVVSLVAAYLAGRTLGPGAAYLGPFRVAGTVAFAGYALALWHDSIWYHRAWSTTLKLTFDGLVYALLTGGVFGWLWPR